MSSDCPACQESLKRYGQLPVQCRVCGADRRAEDEAMYAPYTNPDDYYNAKAEERWGQNEQRSGTQHQVSGEREHQR